MTAFIRVLLTLCSVIIVPTSFKTIKKATATIVKYVLINFHVCLVYSHNKTFTQINIHYITTMHQTHYKLSMWIHVYTVLSASRLEQMYQYTFWKLQSFVTIFKSIINNIYYGVHVVEIPTLSILMAVPLFVTEF